MLALIKQFVKSLLVNESVFKVFSNLSQAKIKEGVFNGSDVRKVLLDDNFQSLLPAPHSLAWNSFRELFNNFLGNNRSPNHDQIFGQMIDHCNKAGCKMSLKVYFLDFFPDSCGQFSEQQCERFHQDISVTENRYKGKWNTQMMAANYCWCLIREDKTAYRRKPHLKTVSLFWVILMYRR